MAEVGTRSRWRDTVIVGALALLLAAGLVYYGHRMTDEPASAPDKSSSTPHHTPRPSWTARRRPIRPPRRPPTGTCWDGRPTTALSLCGLPDGARGLAWVFPSFAKDRPFCHRAEPKPDSYPVVESFECFQRLPRQAGHDHLRPDRGRRPGRGLAAPAARQGEHARGARAPTAAGASSATVSSRPARITGMYERFPYVVSVYAVSPQAAAHAWRQIVRQRPPQFVRGVPANAA